MSQKIKVRPYLSVIVGVQLQKPIVVSPKEGNPNKINLTIMITYAGKPGTSVDMSMVEIEIPMGESARALSDDREGIGIDFNFGTGSPRVCHRMGQYRRFASRYSKAYFAR